MERIAPTNRGEPMSDMKQPAAHQQPVRALRLANRVRRVRSGLKARIAGGELSAAEVILTCSSEIASMPLSQLLASQRGWGEVRSRALLAQVPMREDKSIGSLTERQRRAVASLLAETTAGAADQALTPSGDDVPAPQAAFEIHEGNADGCLRLSLTGELDLASAPRLEDRLAPLRARNSPVRLDLSNVQFIDSTGIQLLIRTVGDARIKRWSFQIEPDVTPQVMRLFRLAHLDHFVMGT